MLREDHKRSMIEWQQNYQLERAKFRGVGFVERTCHACAGVYQVPEKWGYRYYCLECAAEAFYLRRDAINEVQKAIQLGILMRADQFRCADCDAWATAWDHRDYDKPFRVEPVCDSCNRRRPAGYRKRSLPEARAS